MRPDYVPCEVAFAHNRANDRGFRRVNFVVIIASLVRRQLQSVQFLLGSVHGASQCGTVA